jgi:NAD(P)-dependent dehydrogenase (short-subunit alcohol dehydrogenase family)
MGLKDFELTGKTAIVTGAAGGIGKGVATTMAEAGADVVIADISPTAVETAAEISKATGRRCIAVITDVRDTESVEAMVATTMKEFGKIDILVANAGVDIMKPLLLIDGKPAVPLRCDAKFDSSLQEDEWETMLDINLKGYVRCARAVGVHMIKQKSGCIIGIGSVAGIRHGENSVVYAASKAGVHRFSQALALEWAPFNINVNAIAPGAIGPTDAFYVPSWNCSREEHEKSFELLKSFIPKRRFGSVRELGLSCVFLASAAGNYYNGQILVPDGGISQAM